MIIRALALILIFLPGTLAAEELEFELPNSPLGQVLDRSGWLGADRQQNLESKLARYHAEHDVDILVVVWDREIPSELSMHDLARMIGDEWTRTGLWAVILTEPDPVGRPEVRYGGTIAETIAPQSLDTIVSEVVTRGLKDWTDQGRIEAISLGIAREFVYLAQRRDQELAVMREQAAVIHQERSKARKSSLAGIIAKVIGGIGGLIALGAGVFLILQRRKPFEFPETRWRRRLGGEWSGGSTIMVKASTTQPS